MDGKTKAIIAHITLIGWIIAQILNSSEKDEFASYYIRQTLGIWLFGIVSVVMSIIPIVNILGWIITFIFWLLSLISSMQGEKKEVPIAGKYFQDWFKGL